MRQWRALVATAYVRRRKPRPVHRPVPRPPSLCQGPPWPGLTALLGAARGACTQPAVHGPGMCSFGLGFLAECLIVAGVGYDGGPLLSMCFVAAAGGPVAGLLLIQRAHGLPAAIGAAAGVPAAAVKKVTGSLDLIPPCGPESGKSMGDVGSHQQASADEEV